jgi:hypothetical protein
MDDCIEAQWELYIGYMKKIRDYAITIMPLTIIPLTLPQMQRECNDVAFEEFTKHTRQIKLIYPKSKIHDVAEANNS